MSVFQTNFGLLSGSLHPDLSPLLINYKKYLTGFGDQLEKFINIAQSFNKTIIEPDYLKVRLEQDGEFSNEDIDLIVEYYKKNKEDEKIRSTNYSLLSELIYKGMFIECNRNFELFTERLKTGIYRVPMYNGKIDDKYFKSIGLEDVEDMDDVLAGECLASFMPFITESILGKKGYLPNSLILVSGPPGRGKSLFMISEAINALKQGKRVLYAAFGDLDGKDFKSRMTNIILHKEKNTVFLDLNKYYAEAKKELPEIADVTKFKMEIVAPAQFDIDEWISINDGLGTFDNYDIIFVDYDGNIKNSPLLGSDSYDQEGYKYDRLKAIAMTGKIIFVGSQMKISNWNELIIGQEAAADSSKKQRSIDLMLTISKDISGNALRNQNRIGYINIAKNRRGAEIAQRYFLDITGEFVPVSSHLYDELLNAPGPCTLRPELASIGDTTNKYGFSLKTEMIQSDTSELNLEGDDENETEEL